MTTPADETLNKGLTNSADDHARAVHVRGSVRIACGAGFAGDRLDASLDLVRDGDIDVLVLECLAERTLALAQQRMHTNGLPGYDLLLEERLRRVLPTAVERGVTVVTNAGAADPAGAAEMARKLAIELGLDIRIGVVGGDDVLDLLDHDAVSLEDDRPIGSYGRMLSANAYIGAAPILQALAAGADLVITGRVADAALFLAPILHELDRTLEDRALVTAGLVVGHLLECGAQVSGGYFADGAAKRVPDLAHVGFPIADVTPEGEILISKTPGTGGAITRATVIEQLLYEVLDPRHYVTPDGSIDMTAVQVSQQGEDQVRIAVTKSVEPPPGTLKVSVGYDAGTFAEAEISYMGSNSRSSAKLASEVLRQRLSHVDRLTIEIHDGVLDDARGASVPCTRVRVSARTAEHSDGADVIGEVSALYTNGPAGGSGLRTSLIPALGIASTLIGASAVAPRTSILESSVGPEAL